jgi:hypothetical protein
MRLLSTLLCGEVRREESDKLWIVGVYTPNVIVQTLPALVQLTAFQQWESDGVF